MVECFVFLRPLGLRLVIFPVATPKGVKSGVLLDFVVDSTNADVIELEFYSNNQRMVVKNSAGQSVNSIVYNKNRTENLSTVSMYFDKTTPTGQNISVKVKARRNKTDGTYREIVNLDLGNNALTIARNYDIDVMINLTN